MNIIEVKNLSFNYGEEAVLKDISFTAKEGDFISVMGPNGSGKTTLIKIILGLLKLQKGGVKIMGKDIAAFDNWQYIGYLEQKSNAPSLMPLSVFEAARLGLLSGKKMPQIFSKEDNELTLQTLSLCGALDYKDKLFYELSGGQQQRALLARALVNKPRLLILDEPSTALDLRSKENIMDLIFSLNKEKKMTVLFITHNVGESGPYVNKFLVLDKRLIFFGGRLEFCSSKDVTRYFGPYTQHIIDHLHSEDNCPFKEDCKVNLCAAQKEGK